MADGGFDPAVSPLRVFGADAAAFTGPRRAYRRTDLGARVHFSGDLVSKIENGPARRHRGVHRRVRRRRRTWPPAGR